MAETLIRQNQVQLNHVPNRGARPALQDVLGKQIGFSFTAPIVAAPMAREGKVKILAISGDRRSDNCLDPDLQPTGYDQPLFKIRYLAGSPRLSALQRLRSTACYEGARRCCQS